MHKGFLTNVRLHRTLKIILLVVAIIAALLLLAYVMIQWAFAPIEHEPVDLQHPTILRTEGMKITAQEQEIVETLFQIPLPEQYTLNYLKMHRSYCEWGLLYFDDEEEGADFTEDDYALVLWKLFWEDRIKDYYDFDIYIVQLELTAEQTEVDSILQLFDDGSWYDEGSEWYLHDYIDGYEPMRREVYGGDFYFGDRLS